MEGNTMSDKLNITRAQLTAITAPIQMEPDKRVDMWTDIESVSAKNDFEERRARLMARLKLAVAQCCACVHFGPGEGVEPCLTCHDLSAWEGKC
jgi:hypothetical protein